MTDEPTTSEIDRQTHSTTDDSPADDPKTDRRRFLGAVGATLTAGVASTGAAGRIAGRGSASGRGSGRGGVGHGHGGSEHGHGNDHGNAGAGQAPQPVDPQVVVSDFLISPVVAAIEQVARPLSRGDLQVVSATPKTGGAYSATIDTPAGLVRYRHHPDTDTGTVDLDLAVVESTNAVNFRHPNEVMLVVDGTNVEYINRVPVSTTEPRDRGRSEAGDGVDPADLAALICRAESHCGQQVDFCSQLSGGCSASGSRRGDGRGSRAGGRGRSSAGGGRSGTERQGSDCLGGMDAWVYELAVEDQFVSVVRDAPGGTAMTVRTPRAGGFGGPIQTVDVASGPYPLLLCWGWITDAVEAAWEKLKNELIELWKSLPEYPEDFEPWSTCWACCIYDNTPVIKNSDLSVQQLQKRIRKAWNAESLTQSANEIWKILKDLAERFGMSIVQSLRFVSNLVTCAWDCNPPGSTPEGCN